MSGPREDARSSDGLSASTSTQPIMDYSQPFSVLNDRLRPRFTTSQKLYSSLTRLEDRHSSSLGSKSLSYQPTVLITEPEPKVSAKQPENDSGQEDKLSPDSGDDAPQTTCLSELSLKDLDDDSSSTKSDEKDVGGELSSEGGSGTPDNESTFQRGYGETSLPDLIKSGRPLGRRRTVGHVSQTLKEVRREVELSRRRSIKLKAQVDKLQERREGPGWSQDRERVTEEVLSVLRLLYPLTEAGYSQPEPSDGANRLDAALDQLQKVARNLAVSHTAKQEFRSGKDGAEESAVLQQALRDRDEAIEKKKAMEAELLRSRTEMMVLNNQVLEAAQKRLEMSLELEAWKEDFQLLLHQQVLTQQQAEQAPKKTSRLGILRRNNRQPIQRPTSFPMQMSNGSNGGTSSKPPSPGSPSTRTPPSVGSTWRDKLRRGKTSRGGEQDAGGHDSDYSSRDDDGFQVISLD